MTAYLTLIDSQTSRAEMMDAPRQTAKIYTFPQGGRSGNAQSRAALHQSPPPRIDFGSSWYHEAAIREAEPPRKQ